MRYLKPVFLYILLLVSVESCTKSKFQPTKEGRYAGRWQLHLIHKSGPYSTDFSDTAEVVFNDDGTFSVKTGIRNDEVFDNDGMDDNIKIYESSNYRTTIQAFFQNDSLIFSYVIENIADNSKPWDGTFKGRKM